MQPLVGAFGTRCCVPTKAPGQAAVQAIKHLAGGAVCAGHLWGQTVRTPENVQGLAAAF